MESIILAATLLVFVTFFVFCLRIVSEIRGIYAEFQTFVSPGENKSPSPLAQSASVFSDMVARSLVMQAKATLMGLQSGDSRREKGLEGDLALDAVGLINPQISAVLDSFPALKKSLRKHPELLDLAISKLVKPAAAGSAPANNNGHTEGAQTNFNL